MPNGAPTIRSCAKLTRVAALLATLAFVYPVLASADNTCVHCHASMQAGFSAPHAFGAVNCVSCHAGDEREETIEKSHTGLIAFPGNLGNADRACGTCHADRVSSVKENLMHTGHGIVDVTRRLIDGHAGANDSVNMQSLGDGIADTMLRKVCASCHLGQEKTEHRLDPTRDRGGGCLACHINDHPTDAHPALSRNVSDGRCFGCHSRSGRISLSYAGLAEIPPSESEPSPARPRLRDGRHVERVPADVHYQAGMSCIDCHTSVGLMGAAGEAAHQRDAVDIACTDCHVASDAPQTAKHRTPLTHIEVTDSSYWLNTKNTGRRLEIPLTKGDSHLNDGDSHHNYPGHERLTCSACHSQWVPQCFGCHMEYDADGSQWDHVEQAVTKGRWNDQWSEARNAPGALGVNEHGYIEAFVPGMIMTVDHPDWDGEKFLRVFAPLSPHTTGPARSCESCHRSSVAVGLGEGEIVEQDGKLHFIPAHELLRDGLPADAWTNMDGTLGGDTPLPGQRPLNAEEIEAVLSAPLR